MTIIGSSLIIYHSPLPHTYTLSFLHRHPESYRPVTSAPTHYFNQYSHQVPLLPKVAPVLERRKRAQNTPFTLGQVVGCRCHFWQKWHLAITGATLPPPARGAESGTCECEVPLLAKVASVSTRCHFCQKWQLVLTAHRAQVAAGSP